MTDGLTWIVMYYVFLSDVAVLFYVYCDHRDLNVLKHSFPTRRSSVLPFGLSLSKPLPFLPKERTALRQAQGERGSRLRRCPRLITARAMSPSSWTATAAGRRSATCRESPAIARGWKRCGRSCAPPASPASRRWPPIPFCQTRKNVGEGQRGAIRCDPGGWSGH